MTQVTDEMVSRFLSWRLPDDFAPDAGITFKRVYNEARVRRLNLGRDLTSELAEAIAVLSEGNPGLTVIAAQIIAKLPREKQLKFLAGDMTVLKGPK